MCPKDPFSDYYCFLIYINDMQFAISDPHSLRLFADDTGKFNHDKDLKTLISKSKAMLEKLKLWFKSNKLTLNIDKSSYVIFHNRNKKICSYANEIKIGDQVIKRQESAKYIGMILDEKLTWNEHVNMIIRKIVKFFGIFNNMKSYVSSRLARQLYFAFIFPHIKYGIEVYGATSLKNIKRLQVIQNKLLKLLLNKNRLTPTNTIHKENNLLKVNDIHNLYTSLFVRDSIYKETLPLFWDYFPSRINIHNHNTRTRHFLQIPRTRTKLATTSVKYKGATIWNTIKDTAKLSKTRNSFKRHLTNDLLNTYI